METTQTASASPTAISRRVITMPTIVTGGLLAVALVIYHTLNSLSYGELITGVVADATYIFGIAFGPIAAAIVLYVAFSLGVRESVGRQWLLMGLGVTSFAIGDLIWMWLELFRGVDPYPSAADVFYPLQYVFFAAAVVLAIRSYRGFVDIRPALAWGAAVAVTSVAAVYLILLEPYILPAGTDELSALAKFVSILYPVGDVLFMLTPAVTLALVIQRLGAGRFGWPWWFVVAGAFVFSLTDSFYAYADWAGIGTTAALDLGWIAAQLLFAVAALVARDVYRS